MRHLLLAFVLAVLGIPALAAATAQTPVAAVNADATSTPTPTPTPTPPTNATPVLSWVNGQASQSMTGPVPEFAIYYDRYRFGDLAVSRTFQPAPSLAVNVAGTVSDAATALTGLISKAQSLIASTAGSVSYSEGFTATSTPTTTDAQNEAKQRLFEAMKTLAQKSGGSCTIPNVSTPDPIVRYEIYACLIDAAQQQADTWRGEFSCSARAVAAMQKEAQTRIVIFDRDLQAVQIDQGDTNRIVWNKIDKVITTFQTTYQSANFGDLEPSATSTCDPSSTEAAYTQSVVVPTIGEVQTFKRSLSHISHLLGEEALLGTDIVPDLSLAPLRTELSGISVDPMLADGGTRAALYAAMDAAAPFVASIKQKLTVADFVTYTVAGDCHAAGQATVNIYHTDIFTPPAYIAPQEKPDATIATVNCYGKSYVAVGAGYTNLHINSYPVVEKDVGTTATYTLAGPTTRGTFGAALVHTCICAFPNDKANGYYTLGVGAGSQGPIVIGGFSVGLQRSTFFTIGATYGFVNMLSPLGNQPSDSVTSSYQPSYSKRLSSGFMFGFSFAIPTLTGTPGLKTDTTVH